MCRPVMTVQLDSAQFSSAQLSLAQPSLPAMCSSNKFAIAFINTTSTVSPIAMTDNTPTIATGAIEFGAISNNRGVVVGNARNAHIIGAVCRRRR